VNFKSCGTVSIFFLLLSLILAQEQVTPSHRRFLLSCPQVLVFSSVVLAADGLSHVSSRARPKFYCCLLCCHFIFHLRCLASVPEQGWDLDLRHGLSYSRRPYLPSRRSGGQVFSCLGSRSGLASIFGFSYSSNLVLDFAPPRDYFTHA
jgi:hypothetical protein